MIKNHSPFTAPAGPLSKAERKSFAASEFEYAVMSVLYRSAGRQKNPLLSVREPCDSSRVLSAQSLLNSVLTDVAYIRWLEEGSSPWTQRLSVRRIVMISVVRS
ncbi:hypothetical protein D3C75_976180 [compost metagenome]